MGAVATAGGIRVGRFAESSSGNPVQRFPWVAAKLFSVLLGFAFVSVSAWAGGWERFTYTEYLMGVDARLVVYAPSKQVAQDACAAAFERIAQLDAIMSDYRKDSELMRLSDKATCAAVAVSPELFKVLQRSIEVSRRSEGFFDISVGPLVKLWRDARKTGVLPKREKIAQARRLVGWRWIILDAGGRTVRLEKAGMRLDLGAIGKGYADDEAQVVLKRHGITSALVDMGGDIVMSNPPPGKDGWVVQVPDAGPGGRSVELHLANCAVSTSGDTEQHVDIGGVRYSHVVNPHTGYALTTSVQATVIARDGLTADPVSTALTLLDGAGRKVLLKAYGITRAFVRVMR